MHQQPATRSCSNEAIGGAHYGPVIVREFSALHKNSPLTPYILTQVYMAAVSDATTAVGSSASWFKVAQIGLPSNNPEYWGTQVLNVRPLKSGVSDDGNSKACLQNNCGHYTFTVPSIKPGNYLLRAE